MNSEEQILEECQNYRGLTFRGRYRGSLRSNNFGRGRSRSRERQFSSNFRKNDRSSSRSRLGSRANTNGVRIRCFKCREYDHFPKDYPNMSETEKYQTEQMQHMLYLEGGKVSIESSCGRCSQKFD